MYSFTLWPHGKHLETTGADDPTLWLLPERYHMGNTWKPLVLMTRHFDYCPSASEGDNQSVGSSAPVVSRCFPCGYNVKLYISRGRLACWLLAFLCCVMCRYDDDIMLFSLPRYMIYVTMLLLSRNIILQLAWLLGRRWTWVHFSCLFTLFNNSYFCILFSSYVFLSQ